GLVIFPDERQHQALADTPIALAGSSADPDCSVTLKTPEAGTDAAVWQVRIDGEHVTGTRRTRDGHSDAIALRIVPATPCDGGGQRRRFSSPKWAIAVDYTGCRVV